MHGTLTERLCCVTCQRAESKQAIDVMRLRIGTDLFVICNTFAADFTHITQHQRAGCGCCGQYINRGTH